MQITLTINIICMECGNTIAVLDEPPKIDKNGNLNIAIDPHCDECEKEKARSKCDASCAVFGTEHSCGDNCKRISK